MDASRWLVRASAPAALALVGSLAWATAAGAAATWVVVPSPSPTAASSLQGVSAASGADAWAVGAGATQPLAEHWDGSAWRTVPTAPGRPGEDDALTAVADLGPGDAWTVGYAQSAATSALRPLIEHWDGRSWKAVPAAPDPGHTAQDLRGIGGASPTDLWAVGLATGAGRSSDALIEHWNGTRWRRVPSPFPAGSGWLKAVAAISAADVWAVGGTVGGTRRPPIAHWNGRSWTAVPAPPAGGNTAGLQGVSAAGPRNVWAAGFTGQLPLGPFQPLLDHWNGTSWTTVAGPPDQGADLNGVTVLSPSDAWAVGTFGCRRGAIPCGTLVEHWDGQAWADVSTPVPPGSSMNGLNGTASLRGGTVWAAGETDTGTLVIETANG